MNCIDVCSDLPDLLCGNLSSERRQALETHLAACPRCRAEHDSLRQISLLLRVTPAPDVQVDVSAIYREAARRDRQRLLRWRRLTVLVATAAAILLLMTCAFNLEVRLERHQVVVRWGVPPLDEGPFLTTVPAPPPRPTTDPALEQRLRVLQELVQALAADVQLLDVRQREELTRLRGNLEQLRHQSAQQWAAAERDVAALYAERFLSKKGNTP